jgi:ATP-dependent helicase/nuclease subunit B
LAHLPALASVLSRVSLFRSPSAEKYLSADLAERLYGMVLNTSVSRLEQFAACPFKFFVNSGLRAEERKLFELDVKEQGTFQHDVLALFHKQLRAENKRWRDIAPAEARERIGRIAQALMSSYRQGLLQASDESRFTARVLTIALQRFVETAVHWMRNQYLFDPVEVELPFGQDPTFPGWQIELGAGRRLVLQGRIDRIDTWAAQGTDAAHCIVLDYKSSHKQLDPVMVANGLQLQLLAYLNVLRSWPNPEPLFGVRKLIPAGVFYVNLKGRYNRASTRDEALAEVEEARRRAYRHIGRFDLERLRQLDARPDVSEGDQFAYRLTNSGDMRKGCRDAVPTAEFETLLDGITTIINRMGQEIYSGLIEVAPYRKGKTKACDQCEYSAICRIDPWTHRYRSLLEAP